MQLVVYWQQSKQLYYFKQNIEESIYSDLADSKPKYKSLGWHKNYSDTNNIFNNIKPTIFFFQVIVYRSG